jgi:hypothetical protein
MKLHSTWPAPLMAPARRPHLRWPLPALAAWLLAWVACEAARRAGLDAAPAWLVGVATGVALAAVTTGDRWRRAIVAGGFPLSSLVMAAALPGWSWIAAAALLLLAYPLSAWRDAPFFPTPASALVELPEVVTLAANARVLDAGCGLGHGLQALRAAFPGARVDGVERSALLAWVCRWRCRHAQVRRGDMWQTSWQGYDLVYVFQRPESMARAWDKARREMPGGAWFVSLEFEVPHAFPHLRLQAGASAKPLWVYRVGVAKRPQRAEPRGTGAPLALVGNGPKAVRAGKLNRGG